MHAVQPSESTQFGTNGGASSYKWGTHCRTNGGCVSHPRRAHNLVQIIVCYNYHSAELRVRGLPKMALWYICTFGHWYIGTLVHLDIGTSVSPLFPYCRTNGGRPLSTFGGRIITQIRDALSYRWGTHYYPNGGCYPHPMVSLYDRPEDTKVVSKYARLRHLVDTYLDAHK